MADPLSVAAGVVGLLKGSAQISESLYYIIKRVKRAPKACKDARTEVDEIHKILSQLQLFVLGATKASTSRTSLILVDQVVTTLASTVTTFSELDVFVETLDSDEKMGLMDRVRWLMKEKDLKELIQKLHLHKSSMSLMLTILTCQSTVDAEEKVDKLCDLVEQTLKQNVILAERLSSFQAGATIAPDKAAVATEPTGTEQPPNETGQAPSDEPDADASAPQGPRKFVFEELLVNSRVYRNMAFDSSDTFSVLSSAGRTGTWSMLSGLSLSQMSNIAILALPIYASDLNNKERYNFETITEDPIVSVEAEPSNSVTESSSSGKRILSSWRKRFNNEPRQDDPPPAALRIFGVELAASIRYANVAITIQNEAGENFKLGYVPVIVAKCGLFLKNKATEVEHIFAAPGHPTRIKTAEKVFDSPPSYGERFSWDGFTVHDCAAVLLRYLKCLPEPVIPFDHYEKFVRSFRNLPRMARSFDLTVSSYNTQIKEMQRQIRALPLLNLQLLLYLFDLLAVFACKGELNSMTCGRLISAFHPSVLSQRPQMMDEAEHELAQGVCIFLLENQDNFIIGMAFEPST